MTFERLIELLQGMAEDYGSGFAGRPDDSGIRSKGVNRQPDVRLSNFPYDRDVSYGQPATYDRGSGATGPLNNPLTPQDDSTFSLRLLGIEDPAEVEEASGTPSMFGKGGSSNIGSSIPGMGGAWAHDPPREWDESEMEEDSPLTIVTSVPPPEPAPGGGMPDFRGETDDDLENRLNRIWGQEDNLNFVDPNMFGQPDTHMIAHDPWSVINSRLNSRGLYGLMPKESAWDRVTGAGRRKREIS